MQGGAEKTDIFQNIKFLSICFKNLFLNWNSMPTSLIQVRWITFRCCPFSLTHNCNCSRIFFSNVPNKCLSNPFIFPRISSFIFQMCESLIHTRVFKYSHKKKSHVEVSGDLGGSRNISKTWNKVIRKHDSKNSKNNREPCSNQNSED